MCSILPFSTNKTGAAPNFLLNRNDGKSYYAIAQNDERGIINFVIYDEANPKDPDNIQQMSDNSFLECLSSALDSRFKGVILHLFEFQPSNFRSNYEFCCEIRKRLAALQIPYHFAARTEKNTSSALIGANISSKIGDIVLSILGGDFIIGEYKYTENGYIIINNWGVPYIPEPEAATKAKIMGESNRKVIVGFSPFNHISTCKLASIMKVEKKFVMVDLKEHGYKYPGEMIKWMLDKSYVKFYLPPIAWKNTGIAGMMGKEMCQLLYVKCDLQLPLKESVIVSKIFSHYLVHSINENNKTQPDLLCKRTLPMNCHKIEITVAMDINQFLTVKANETVIPENEALPKKLYEICDHKIPVIGFFENSALICVSKDCEEYKFLEQWGGLYGDELFINFGTEPVTFGLPAITPFKTSMNFVVFDLIKIMSMTPNNIKKDPK